MEWSECLSKLAQDGQIISSLMFSAVNSDTLTTAVKLPDSPPLFDITRPESPPLEKLRPDALIGMSRVL